MKNNVLRKFAGLFLCLCMIAVLALTSACNTPEQEAVENSEPKIEQYALALRAIDEIESGDSFALQKN